MQYQRLDGLRGPKSAEALLFKQHDRAILTILNKKYAMYKVSSPFKLLYRIDVPISFSPAVVVRSLRLDLKGIIPSFGGVWSIFRYDSN